MRLIELFDRVADYKLKKISPSFYEARFSIGSVKYVVDLELGNAKTLFTVDHLPPSEENDVFADALQITKDGDEVLDVQFRSGRRKVGLTGHGHEILVFSTVLSIIDKVIDISQPKWLILSAEEPNRASLYRRLVTRFAPKQNIIEYPFSPATRFLVRLP